MTNLNHGLFRQFISTLSNTAGSFVKAFDSNNDQIVVKGEFQAKMWANQSDYVNNWDGNANNTTEYRDLINEFWNSFDDIYKKGNIKDTNIEHAFAIDKTEQNDVQREMDVYFNIASIMQFSALKQYTHTYNFISNKIAEVILADESGNTTVTEDDFKKLLADILTNQSPDFKKAILNDALEMVVSSTRYTTTNGYNPLKDSELISRVEDKIETLTFKEGKDPVQAVVDYFNETQGENFADMRATTNEYLGDTTLADPKNNYQIARLTNTYISELDTYINKNIGTNPNVTGDLLEKAQTKGLEAIELAVNILLEVNNDKIGIDQLYNTINNIETTDPGKDYKNYLYSLSLGDVNKGDEFYNEFLENLKEKYPVGNEAEQIANALVEMDLNYPEYQFLIEEIANTVSDFNDGKVYTENDIRKILLDKLLNGNIEDVDGVECDPWIDELIEEAGIDPTRVEFLTGEILIRPNGKKTIDIANVYVGGKDTSSKDVEFDAQLVNPPNGASVSMTSDGRITINAPANECDLTVTVKAKYQGIELGTQTYTIKVTNDIESNSFISEEHLPSPLHSDSAFGVGPENWGFSDDLGAAKTAVKTAVNKYIDTLVTSLKKYEDYDPAKIDDAAQRTKDYFKNLINALEKVGSRNTDGDPEVAVFEDPTSGHDTQITYVRFRRDSKKKLWNDNACPTMNGSKYDVVVLADSNGRSKDCKIAIRKSFIRQKFIEIFASLSQS